MSLRFFYVSLLACWKGLDDCIRGRREFHINDCYRELDKKDKIIKEQQDDISAFQNNNSSKQLRLTNRALKAQINITSEFRKNSFSEQLRRTTTALTKATNPPSEKILASKKDTEGGQTFVSRYQQKQKDAMDAIVAVNADFAQSVGYMLVLGHAITA